MVSSFSVVSGRREAPAEDKAPPSVEADDVP
jgi:hypothetical protein